MRLNSQNVDLKAISRYAGLCKEPPMSLGDHIRAARKNKSLSQRALAELVDSDASYINRIEAEKSNPTIGMLEKIAAALECTIDELVRGSAPDVSIQSSPLAERLRLVESLEDEDRRTIVHMIDTMLTKQRMRQLLADAAA